MEEFCYSIFWQKIDLGLSFPAIPSTITNVRLLKAQVRPWPDHAECVSLNDESPEYTAHPAHA